MRRHGRWSLDSIWTRDLLHYNWLLRLLLQNGRSWGGLNLLRGLQIACIYSVGTVVIYIVRVHRGGCHSVAAIDLLNEGA